MTDEHLNERLSAYLDGELSGEELAAAEAHLAACGECRATLEGLRGVVWQARALDDRPPVKNLWPAIAERLGSPAQADVVPIASRRRLAFSVPQLAAAAVLLMALSAGGTALFVRGGAPAASQRRPSSVAVTAAGFPAARGVRSYDLAIRELEAALAARRSELDSATVRAVERSLRIIDQAIVQAQAALARDPNNVYLNGHLRNALDRKLDLLRRAAVLPAVS